MDTGLKKRIVLYGNCHMSNLVEIFQQCSDFNEKYEVVPLDAICNVKSLDYFKNSAFSSCDVFLHQSIQRNNRYGEEYASENVIKLLKNDCRVISVPNVYHLPTCFFPQYTELPEFKDEKGGTVFFRDCIIDELFMQGLNCDEIHEQYINGTWFQEQEIKDSFCAFLEKLSLREQDWDIKVKEFIEEKYKDNQLFYDPNHPTPFFMKYIAKQCLDMLGVVYDDYEIDNMIVTAMDTYEMPIMSDVKKYLQLSYQSKEIRKTGINQSKRMMDNKEYIRQYIAYEWQNEEISKLLRHKSRLAYLEIEKFFMLAKIKCFLKKNPLIFKLVCKRNDYRYKKELKSFVTSKKIRELKDCKVGKRCFIIGNGPSLQVEDLEMLQQEDSFAVNRIYKIFQQTNWRPTYYCCQDTRVLEEIATDMEYILNECSNVFLNTSIARDITNYLEYKNLYMFFVNTKRYYPNLPNFSFELDKQAYEGFTVTYACIQLAVYMGYSEIYLLGIDHAYNTNRTPDGTLIENKKIVNYMPGLEGKLCFAPQLENSTLAYKKSRAVCEKLSIRICNATRGGYLEEFERVDFDTLF